MTKNKFLKGLGDGIPICLGYISVSFAFGIFSVGSGLTPIQTVLISMTNVTSAGQLAAVPIIASAGSLIELALLQFIINLRYALMSVSLSQKVDKTVSLLDRFIISFVNTDEVFAVASGKPFSVGRAYLYGLIIMPYIGWSTGTLIGAFAGNILPESVVSALGIAIYAMLIAVVVPECRKKKSVFLCVMLSILMGCILTYVPVLSKIPSGLTIIISGVVASAVFAYFFPVKTEEDEHEK